MAVSLRAATPPPDAVASDNIVPLQRGTFAAKLVCDAMLCDYILLKQEITNTRCPKSPPLEGVIL